jgi:hypothetical protein
VPSIVPGLAAGIPRRGFGQDGWSCRPVHRLAESWSPPGDARPQAIPQPGPAAGCVTHHHSLLDLTHARTRAPAKSRARARTHARTWSLSLSHTLCQSHTRTHAHARTHTLSRLSLSHTHPPHLLTHSHAQAPMDARTDLGTHARTFHSATIMLIHPGARAGSAGPDRGPFRAGPQAALPLPACGPGAGAPDDSDCARRCRRHRRRCLAGPPHGPQRIVVVPAGPTVPGRAR